ncbi:unnamed protein product [Rhizophagus irregularis]|nr:unnamed protein product [Rhizophagus irregularis]
MEEAAFQITQYVRRPEENQRELRNTRPVFDGQSNMFAFRKLQSDASTFDVELAEENVPVGRTRPPRRFTVRIRKTREIILEELFQFLNARGSMTENCNMAIMAMDILISHKIAAIYPTTVIIPISSLRCRKEKPISSDRSVRRNSGTKIYAEIK